MRLEAGDSRPRAKLAREAVKALAVKDQNADPRSVFGSIFAGVSCCFYLVLRPALRAQSLNQHSQRSYFLFERRLPSIPAACKLNESVGLPTGILPLST